MKDNTNKQYREDLTQEDFEKAAQQLASQSKSVTIRGIKELVGGSNETISKCIRVYQQKLMVSKFKSSMPESYQDKVMELSVNLFNFFESKITEDRISLQDEYDKKHAEIDSLIKNNDEILLKLNEKLNSVEDELKQAKIALSDKDKRIAKLESQLSDLNELNSKLNSQLENSIKENQQKILDILSSIANK